MGIPWDGTGINLLWDGNGTDKYVPWTTLFISLSLVTDEILPLELLAKIGNYCLHGRIDFSCIDLHVFLLPVVFNFMEETHATLQNFFPYLNSSQSRSVAQSWALCDYFDNAFVCKAYRSLVHFSTWPWCRVAFCSSLLQAKWNSIIETKFVGVYVDVRRIDHASKTPGHDHRANISCFSRSVNIEKIFLVISVIFFPHLCVVPSSASREKPNGLVYFSPSWFQPEHCCSWFLMPRFSSSLCGMAECW